MRRNACIVAIVLSMPIATGCSEKAQVVDPEIARAEAYGRIDADKVIKAHPGTMEREHAILNIRVTQRRIAVEGDTAWANAYARAAEARLDSAGVFACD